MVVGESAEFVKISGGGRLRNLKEKSGTIDQVENDGDEKGGFVCPAHCSSSSVGR